MKEKILNECSQLKTFLEILKSHQDNAEICSQEVFGEIDKNISDKIKELIERDKHPEFISDTITNMFSGFESLACWCIASIVILVVAQEVICTSDIISGWCKSVFMNVFSEGTINDISRSLLAYLKLSSLSMQLIFLHSSCQNVFQWVRLVKISR